MMTALQTPALVKSLTVADIAPVSYSTTNAQWGEISSIVRCTSLDVSFCGTCLFVTTVGRNGAWSRLAGEYGRLRGPFRVGNTQGG